MALPALTKRRDPRGNPNLAYDGDPGGVMRVNVLLRISASLVSVIVLAQSEAIMRLG